MTILPRPAALFLALTLGFATGPVIASTPAASVSGATAMPIAGRPLTRDDADAWLDGYMPYALASGDIPGAIVTIVRDGHVVTERGYGLADVARHVPVDPRRTLFRVGSVSKLFTWTAVMQLVEQHRIGLDDDVNRYLDFPIPPYRGRPVTMRNLMTHTAGFEEARDGIATTAGTLAPLGEALRRAVPPRVFAPGSTPAYSNYGAALAGYIVQRISGEPFETYIDRHILAPLGMRRTTFIQPLPAALGADVAKGYVGDGHTPGGFETVVWRPAGSMSTTADDMARFMIAHLQEGALGSARILAPATARAMHDTPDTIIPGLDRMELGFYEIGINGHRVVGHHGDTVLFHAMLALLPDERTGIFMAFNGPGRAGATSQVRERLFEQFADRYFPGPPARAVWLDAATARNHSAMFAGAYENSRGYFTSFLTFMRLLDPVRVIVRADGDVSLSGYNGPDGQPKRFRETTPFHWQEVDGHDRMAALVEHGRIVRLAASGFSPIMMFDAVPAWRAPVPLRAMFAFGVVAMLSLLILWPAGAAIRRYHDITAAHDQSRVVARRWVRSTAAVALLAVVGWGWLLAQIMTPTGIYFLGGHRFAIRLIEILTIVGFVGVVAASAYRTVVAWRTGERWPVRIASAGLFVATAGTLYTAVVYRMAMVSTVF